MTVSYSSWVAIIVIFAVVCGIIFIYLTLPFVDGNTPLVWADWTRAHKYWIFLFVASFSIALGVGVGLKHDAPTSKKKKSKNKSICSTYKVVSGDTCYAIASRLNIPVDALVAANPLCPDIKSGDILFVPPSRGYIVRAGDSCYTIANAFNLSLKSLMDANPDKCGDNLQVGDLLCIPPPPGTIAPDTAITGYFYYDAYGECINNAKLQNAPIGANLSAYFEFGQDQYPDQRRSVNYWSDPKLKSSTNCPIRAYTMGGNTYDWNAFKDKIDGDLKSIKATGYFNAVIFDIENKSCTADQLADMAKKAKSLGLMTMIYATQYASNNFVDTVLPKHVADIDYGIPSIYGANAGGDAANCNYTTICDISWWTSLFPLSKIILGITVGSWPVVSNYTHGNTTVADAGFGGYIEWVYSIPQCTTNIDCGTYQNVC